MSSVTQDMSGPVSVEFSLPATRDSLRLVRLVTESFLVERAPKVLPERREEVLLAMQEACTNVVRHAYSHVAAPGTLGVSLRIDRGQLSMAVIDEGMGYDPSSVPSPDCSPPREGGMGVYLIHQVMSKVTYERRDAKNVLRMECCLATLEGD